MHNTLLKNLYHRNKHCHWCNCRTWRGVRPADIPVDCRATVDHIKSKPEAKTHEEYIAKENKVLACYKCNQERARVFNKANPNAQQKWQASPTDYRLKLI